MATRRYELYLRVLKNISRVSTADWSNWALSSDILYQLPEGVYLLIILFKSDICS